MNEFSLIDNLEGKISLPGDKSISHRTVIIASLAKGETCADNFLNSDDCICTVEAFRRMGVAINLDKDKIRISGKGLRGLLIPENNLYMGGSGTTLRLLLGVLAGQKFKTTLNSDESLSKRPMKRVTEPLREMGAKISGPDDANFTPLTVEGNDLEAIEYNLSIPSAQVKSAILLAGLYAKGKTKVAEPAASRDHTERMLKLFGAKIEKDGLTCSIEGWPEFKGMRLSIPGDISSAVNFITLAALIKNARLCIESVGLNPTRIGAVKVLKRMNANIEITIKGGEDFEPFGDIEIFSSKLKAANIKKEEIPSLIDELPILMVAASFAKGQTIIEGADELRVKETDRINSMVTNLRIMGAKIAVENNIIIINGGVSLKGSSVSSFGDHRTAMSMIIAGLSSSGKTRIDDVKCINKSFPEFFDILKLIVG